MYNNELKMYVKFEKVEVILNYYSVQKKSLKFEFLAFNIISK